MIKEGLILVGLGILKKVDSFYGAIDGVVERGLDKVADKIRARKLRRATEYVRKHGYELSMKDRVRIAGRVWYVGEIDLLVSLEKERAELTLIRAHELLEMRRAKSDSK